MKSLLLMGYFLATLIDDRNVHASVPDKVCDSSVLVSEKDISDFIFRNYSNGVRPRRNASEIIDVTLSFRINAVHELIERQNTIVLDGYLYAGWRDDYLKWNTTFPLSCIKQLTVPHGSTWLPDVSVMNSPSGMYSLMTAAGFTVRVRSDGEVYYSPGGQIMSNCEVDVTYFPFDKQICLIHFESWNYDVSTQLFRLDERHPFVKIESSWTENKQWLLESNYSRTKYVRYFGQEFYHHAEFALILRRKALFYYVNIIVPSIIIAVVELATFVLPIDEVIKIHISFTCLLAYSVFQGMVIADLPRAGDSVPLMSLYIDLQMGYIGIIALMGEAVVFLIIRKANLRKRLPPEWLFSSIYAVGRVLAVDYIYEMNVPKPDPENEKAQNDPSGVTDPTKLNSNEFPLSANALNSGNRSNGDTKGSTLEQQSSSITSKTDEIHYKWLYIAEVVERFNTLLYIAAISITPVVMFNIIPSEDTTVSDHKPKA